MTNYNENRNVLDQERINDIHLQREWDIGLSTMFEEQVERTPDIVAVTFNNIGLTYQDLNHKANQLAHYLSKKNIGKGHVIALFMNRSVDMIVGMLGVLKTGAAYLPLDSAIPRERLDFIVDEAQVPLFLTHRELVEHIPNSVECFCMDTDWEILSSQSINNPEVDRSMNDVAYVIYTSGSTGKPKGVEVRHIGVANLLLDMNNQHQMNIGGKSSFWVSFGFDAAVYEIYTCLLFGGTLFIVPEEGRFEPSYYMKWLQENRLEYIFMPPFMLEDFSHWLKVNKKGDWSLKRLITGLEPIKTSIIAEILDQMPHLQIINGYGPTETTICSTLYFVTTPINDYAYLPIGKKVQNTTLYVLDHEQNPVAYGEAGELFIGGLGVAKGYLNRPDLTDEKFVELTIENNKPERLYRTGDIVKYLPDGNLHFIGRADNQVKLRGYRIELGEIERTLVELHSIKEAVVLLREDEPNDKRLVAYLVLKQSEVDHIEISSYLMQRLPKYMLPDVFVKVEQMPLSINGKLDKKALPTPDSKNVLRNNEGYAPPKTKQESWIAEVWSKLLHVNKVGINDDFFLIGGNSLLATQMLGKVKSKYKVDFQITLFFKQPTISSLIQLINQRVQNNPSFEDIEIRLVSRENMVPATFSQERVWFLNQLVDKNLAYHAQAAFHIKGHLKIDILQQSLDEIVLRHEIFRTTFPTQEGKLMQKIHHRVQLILR